MRVRFLTAAAVLALFAHAAMAQVRIGLMVSATGPTSAIGIPQKNTAELLPKTAGNATIEYFQLEDGGDTTRAVQNAKKLIGENNVDAIIGPSTTPNALAILDVIAEAKVPLMATVGTSSVVDPIDAKRRWVFKTTQNDDLIAGALNRNMSKNSVKTVGFIGYNDAYGEVWLNELQAKAPGAGMKVVAVERFARSDTSVTAQALKVVGANPDAVLIVATGSGAAMPQKGLVERGYKGKMYQTHAAATRDLMRIGGKDVEGTWVVSGPALVGELLPDSNPSKNAALDFAQTYEKAYGAGSRNQFAAHSYDAVILLNHALPIALKKAKPGTKEFRAALRDAFEQLGAVPVSHGVLNYTANDHWGFTLTTGVMLKVVNGDWALEK